MKKLNGLKQFAEDTKQVDAITSPIKDSQKRNLESQDTVLVDAITSPIKDPKKRNLQS